MTRPVPEISELGRPYWDAVQRRELHLQKCAACHRYNPSASRWCASCLGLDLAWTRVSGRGRVRSFSIIHQAPTPAFSDDVPYAVGIIELQEGVAIMTNIVNCPVEDIAIDMPVRLTFEQRIGGFLIPQFERDKD